MIQVRIIHNISETTLADMLNAGWSVMHMQFIPVPAGYEDTSVEHLNVVLQLAVADGLPPQPKDDDSIPMSKRLESDDLESDLENALWDDEDEIGGFPSTYSGEDDDEDEDRGPAINPDEIPF